MQGGNRIICFGCHLLAASCTCIVNYIKAILHFERISFVWCRVRAAGLIVGAAADSPAEKLSGLHGGRRLVHLLPRTPAPVQGPVVPGVGLLFSHQRPGPRSSGQTSLHHRWAWPSFFLLPACLEVFILSFLRPSPRSGVRLFDAEAPVHVRKHQQPPGARRTDPEHLVPAAGDWAQGAVRGTRHKLGFDPIGLLHSQKSHFPFTDKLTPSKRKSFVPFFF